MQSDPADTASKAGHSRLWVAGLVLLAIVAAVFAVVRDGGDTVITPNDDPGSGPARGVTTREDSAAELLTDLATNLSQGNRSEALRLAAPGSKEATHSLAAIFDNVQDLEIENLSLRYVDEGAGEISRHAQQKFDDRAWVADVQVGWQIDGFDKGLSQMEVSFVFVETPQGAAFLSAGAGEDTAAPLWLLSDLAVKRSQRSLVMAADRSELAEFSALADQAVADVKLVLPNWRGDLVVEVPASQQQLDHMLNAEKNSYDSIAALTTTVDGSLSRFSPTHILVNPGVFDRLGADGAQIVMSHEATHVATDAARSSMPMWLLEGFADYVALAHVDLPVSVTASQILGDVRGGRPPEHLPGGEEFDPSNKALGASYESAWLACRLLAERYGEQELIAFYREVDEGMSIEEAFSRMLNTNQRAFTKEWQEYLRQLAA